MLSLSPTSSVLPPPDKAMLLPLPATMVSAPAPLTSKLFLIFAELPDDRTRFVWAIGYLPGGRRCRPFRRESRSSMAAPYGRLLIQVLNSPVLRLEMRITRS